VKEAAASGVLGLPLLWKGVHRNARPPYDSSGAFILMNTAGHDIDSARWLLGEEVLEVEARGLRSRPELPEGSRDLLLVQMLMTRERLASAEIFVSADYGYEVEAELVCQRGTAQTAQPEGALVRRGALRASPVAPDWTGPFQAAYLAEVQAWVDSILTGQAFPGASAWDGYVAMRVSAMAAQSLEAGRSLKVELSVKPSLYN
jgi:myo-inositol 2-dehydrogenase/D-chiro-inositol 1-dehydrogenase